ncbi:MAG: hypothetical protein RR957_04305, partial [Oscillospiraceae bacterium]
MKICTVTFQAAINYGAVLQTYALQRVFKDMGHECDVLNYECPAIKKADISFDKAYIKNIKNLISSSLYYFINRIKHRKFVRFSKKNISYSLFTIFF